MRFTNNRLTNLRIFKLRAYFEKLIWRCFGSYLRSCCFIAVMRMVGVVAVDGVVGVVKVDRVDVMVGVVAVDGVDGVDRVVGVDGMLGVVELVVGLQQKVGIQPSYQYEGHFGHFL